MSRDYERDDRETYWRRQEQDRDRDREREPNRDWERGQQNRWTTGGREQNYGWGPPRGREQEGWQESRQENRQENRDWRGEEDYDRTRRGPMGTREMWGRAGERQRTSQGYDYDRGEWPGGGERWEGRQQETYGRERNYGMQGNETRFGREGGWGPGEWNQETGRRRETQWGGTQGSFAGRGPRNFKRSDQRLEEDINEQLTRNPMIDASDIEVNVQNCEVTLRGHVDNREAKRTAEDVVESVFGVKDVNNQIKVRQRGETEERHETESGGKRERKVS